VHKGDSPTLKCPTPAAPPQDPSAYPCVTNVLPLRMTGLGLGGPSPKHLPLRTRPGQGSALPCSHQLGLGHCTLLRVSLPKPSPKHPTLKSSPPSPFPKPFSTIYFSTIFFFCAAHHQNQSKTPPSYPSTQILHPQTLNETTFPFPN